MKVSVIFNVDMPVEILHEEFARAMANTVDDLMKDCRTNSCELVSIEIDKPVDNEAKEESKLVFDAFSRITTSSLTPNTIGCSVCGKIINLNTKEGELCDHLRQDLGILNKSSLMRPQGEPLGDGKPSMSATEAMQHADAIAATIKR